MATWQPTLFRTIDVAAFLAAGEDPDYEDLQEVPLVLTGLLYSPATQPRITYSLHATEPATATLQLISVSSGTPCLVQGAVPCNVSRGRMCLEYIAQGMNIGIRVTNLVTHAETVTLWWRLLA